MAHHTHSPVVGIDLGGTNMQIGVVDESNAIIGRTGKKTQAEQGLAKVLDRMVEGIEAALEHAELKMADLGAIGIGAPSPIDPGRGVVTRAVNLGWTDVHLAEILTQRLRVPVFVDNDVNVAVVGEHRMGAGRGVDDLMGVWIGTGVGGGLVLGGRPYSGPLFTGGEIGHTILFPGAPRGSNSVENFCSRSAIAARLVARIRSGERSVITDLTKGKLTGVKSRIIARAYAEGDEVTRDVIDQAARLLGVAISNYVTVLGLSRIVLGGGLTEAVGEPFVQRVRSSVREHCFFEQSRGADVVASTLEDNAGLLGAAIIAREKAG